MSIESILLVAFLLFPLLERLSRHLRERAAQAPADPAGVPPQRPVPTRPRQPGVPAEEATASGLPGRPAGAPAQVAVPPPLPIPLRHPAVDRLSASDRVRAARLLQTEVVAPPAAPRTRPRARLGLTRPGGRADLRRAVVLMAVLGPCKALESEPGRR